jgi:hypothetical protein
MSSMPAVVVAALAEMLEAEHWTEPQLDRLVILFDEIVIWHV